MNARVIQFSPDWREQKVLRLIREAGGSVSASDLRKWLRGDPQDRYLPVLAGLLGSRRILSNQSRNGIVLSLPVGSHA